MKLKMQPMIEQLQIFNVSVSQIKIQNKFLRHSFTIWPIDGALSHPKLWSKYRADQQL